MSKLKDQIDELSEYKTGLRKRRCKRKVKQYITEINVEVPTSVGVSEEQKVINTGKEIFAKTNEDKIPKIKTRCGTSD